MKKDAVIIFNISQKDKDVLVKIAQSKRISLASYIRQTLITTPNNFNTNV